MSYRIRNSILKPARKFIQAEFAMANEIARSEKASLETRKVGLSNLLKQATVNKA